MEEERVREENVLRERLKNDAALQASLNNKKKPQ